MTERIARVIGGLLPLHKSLFGLRRWRIRGSDLVPAVELLQGDLDAGRISEAEYGRRLARVLQRAQWVWVWQLPPGERGP